MNIWLDVFGYIGMALVLVSMMMTSLKWLRIRNMSGAVICAVIFFLAAGALTRIETIGKNGKNIIRVYLECDDAAATNAVLDILTGDEYGLYGVEITQPRTGISNHLGIEAIMPIPNKGDNKKELVNSLSRVEHILFAVETV